MMIIQHGKNIKTFIFFTVLVFITAQSVCASHNVILISIDILRADKLGCYGNPDTLTPYLDLFAKQNQQWETAVTNATWTLPSHVSMLTGVYPHQHGVEDHENRMDANQPTLAGAFHDAGYITVAHVSTNPNLDPRYGYSKGFDIYEYGRDNKNGECAVNGITPYFEWYVKHKKYHVLASFFLFLHFDDIHPNYNWLPDIYQKMFTDVHSLFWLNDYWKYNFRMYQSAVYYTDRQMGRLWQSLIKTGLYGNTIIFIVSDHGEAFNEHGHCNHGRPCYPEESRIIWLLHEPDNIPAVHTAMVQCVDIPDTLLERANLNDLDNPGIQPRPFSIKDNRGVIFMRQLCGFTYTVSVSKGTYKYSAKLHINSVKLYDGKLYNIIDDPGERTVLPVEKYGKEYQEMKALLIEILQDNPRTVKDNLVLDDEMIKRLKAMGYMK